jgi:4-hydroxythreonine-4-phosphate dehydrogenase
MGDPAGIGPEVVVKALADPEVRSHCQAIVVGDAPTIERAVRLVGSGLRVNLIEGADHARFAPGTIDVLHLRGVMPTEIPVARLSAAAGRSAYESVAVAVRLALAGEVDGVVTAPLNKEALNLAGHRYAGHTEILRDLTGAGDVAMLLWAESLRVVHVTGHTSLRRAIDGVRRERISAVAKLGEAALRRMGIERSRVALAGLNPHAGEHGLFGDEEEREIAPAVEELRAAGIDASGPHPPDTLFVRALKGEFDLVVAMYHDQGHIPMKLVAFDSGVNITLGLPIVRTSPDHGTAFDIAGTGKARPDSMVHALRAAWRLCGVDPLGGYGEVGRSQDVPNRSPSA